MKFELNQELTLKNAQIKVKITGLRNGSQPVIISGSGENYYDIEVSGFRSCISEPMLDLLMKDVPKPKLEINMEIIKPVIETIKEVKQKIKKNVSKSKVIKSKKGR